MLPDFVHPRALSATPKAGLATGRDHHRISEPMTEPIRIAMWSGPRNISTAMMRAWENRGDCAISDEPLYAHFLHATGADHPARDAVIAAGETDWRNAVADLQGPVPDGKPIWYQKHMTHHLTPEMDRQWIGKLTNVLLIRDPTEVVASYVDRRGTVSPEEIGQPQQLALYEEIATAQGRPPPVIDAGAFLKAPGPHLRTLCRLLGVPFTDRMLHWPSGPRPSDGVWAPHWYARVWQSTGFESPRPRKPQLHGPAAEVAEACRPIYQWLYDRRLMPEERGCAGG